MSMFHFTTKTKDSHRNMSETGETYKALKSIDQDKRAKARDRGLQAIRSTGYSVEVKNDGAHLIVRNGGKTADYWPGTGGWKVRGTGRTGEGYLSLAKELENPGR